MQIVGGQVYTVSRGFVPADVSVQGAQIADVSMRCGEGGEGAAPAPGAATGAASTTGDGSAGAPGACAVGDGGGAVGDASVCAVGDAGGSAGARGVCAVGYAGGSAGVAGVTGGGGSWRDGAACAPDLADAGCDAGGMEASAPTFPTFTNGSAGERIIDASGCFVVPGFVDLHFHGAVGADMCDGTREALLQIARYEASRGVTSICPATMTLAHERLFEIMGAAADFADAAEACDYAGEFADCAAFVGINMEGPFISPGKVGAQNPQFVRCPSWEEFADLQDAAGGLIAICDIAPEEEGAIEFVRRATNAGVRVSVAHTTADYTQAMFAFDAGAEQLTHTFNAMPGLHHREPGPIAAAADCPWVSAELIADGVHVHPAMIRLAFKLFGVERMLLVSDTMRACGMPDGTYDLGGQEVSVSGKVATLANGALAGSVSDLATCVQYAVRHAGVSLDDAVRAASTNPARALGLVGAGDIAPGCGADLVVLDAELNVREVVLRGHVL